MGLVSSVGSKMMRPPVPPSYGIENERFTDGWRPGETFEDRSYCPIVMRWPDRLGSGEARQKAASELEYEVVKRKTREKNEIAILRVWNTKETERPLLIYSKGNSFDLGILRFHCLQLALILKCDVICYDYTGYGASGGLTPSVTSTLADAEAVFDYAKSINQKQRPIVLYGFSLGNGPTLHLASKYKDEVQGIILRSPFVSGVGVATDIAQRRVSPWIPMFSFPSFFDVWPCQSLIKNVKAPTLIIHGDQDELIRPWQPKKLLADCPTAVTPFFKPNLGHFDIERHPDYVPRLISFLNEELLTVHQ